LEHLSPAEIEAIVMGAEPADEPVRRHMSECPVCAERLEREARLEEALHEGALANSAVRSVRVGAEAWRVVLPAAATLVIVAAGAWLATSRNREVALVVPMSAAPAMMHDEPRQDAPGLRDPMSFAPGYVVIAPSDYCRWVVAPAE
jgi:hypothetical protein